MDSVSSVGAVSSYFDKLDLSIINGSLNSYNSDVLTLFYIYLIANIIDGFEF